MRRARRIWPTGTRKGRTYRYRGYTIRPARGYSHDYGAWFSRHPWVWENDDPESGSGSAPTLRDARMDIDSLLDT